MGGTLASNRTALDSPLNWGHLLNRPDSTSEPLVKATQIKKSTKQVTTGISH